MDGTSEVNKDEEVGSGEQNFGSMEKSMDGINIHRDEELGRGVFGAAVYRGTFNDNEVAIKSIPKARTVGECDEIQESNILSLNHDGVVKIHRVEENDHSRCCFSLTSASLASSA